MTFIRRCVKEIKIIKYYEYIPKVNINHEKKNTFVYYQPKQIINNIQQDKFLDDYEIKYINYIKKNGGL